MTSRSLAVALSAALLFLAAAGVAHAAERKLLTVPVCATKQVVIPIGQRCGGDRNGCCQSTNIGNIQNQYPACSNPNPSVKPAYCQDTNPQLPWNCDKFTCESGATCACSFNDCTCTSNQNLDNIKNNNPGYSSIKCFPTTFGGPAACQNSNYCFPADAFAMIRDPVTGLPAPKRLSATVPSDLAQVVKRDGRLAYSAVYLFPHFQTTGTHTFMQLTTETNSTIRMTPDHYALVTDTRSAAFAGRKAVAAADVQPGMFVWRTHAFSRTVAPELVIKVDTVTGTGIINPFTLEGNIVIDGIVASSYSTMLGSEAAMHSFTAIGRALYHVAPGLFRFVHARRVAEPISLAIGRAAAKTMQLTGGMAVAVA